MKGFYFLNYQVYKDARTFKLEIEKIFNMHEWQNKYELKNQLTRALYSIALNIAEGSSRVTRKDFKRFLLISMGSLNEVIACLDIAKESKLISEKEFDIFIEKGQNIARQLNGLMKTLH
jgi:four helix bundle protein